MDEFFKFVIQFFGSWRWRTGCYALALACFCAGLWVRSQSIFDLVTLSVGDFDMTIGSCHRGLIVLPQKALSISQTCYGDQSGQTCEVRLKFRNEPISNAPGLNWNSMKASKLDIYQDGKLSPLQNKMIPYWTITIPLTLIAASLLLTKAKTSTPKKILETIPNENGA